MKHLLKNLFLSSIPCFILFLIIGLLICPTLFNALNNLEIIDRVRIFGSIYLGYNFFVWPIIQSIIFIHFFGFKSILIKIRCWFLFYLSIPIGWYTVYILNKLSAGIVSSDITLLSQTSYYLTFLLIQSILFFLFVKKSLEVK